MAVLLIYTIILIGLLAPVCLTAVLRSKPIEPASAERLNVPAAAPTQARTVQQTLKFGIHRDKLDVNVDLVREKIDGVIAGSPTAPADRRLHTTVPTVRCQGQCAANTYCSQCTYVRPDVARRHNVPTNTPIGDICRRCSHC